MVTDLLENIMRQIHARDHIPCPYCGVEIDMTDCERVMGHVSFWGEDEPAPEDCPHCGKTVFLQERVERSWTAGKTPDEARHG